MNLLKYFALCFFGAVFSSNVQSAVYVVAHPDDAELLMSGNLYSDIRAGYPTHVVVLTAGDSGNLTQANIRQISGNHDHNSQGNPYYRVRLNAHEKALYWNMVGNISRTTEYFSSDAPSVEKNSLGNVTIYYLNLPDGKLNETWNLTDDFALAVTDIAGVNRYSKNSLRITLREIIRRNYSGVPTIVLNFHEYDPAFYKPGYNDIAFIGGMWTRPADLHIDSPDHTAAGKFTRMALNEGFGCVHTSVYMGYGISETPDSISSDQKNYQIVAFGALNNILIAQGNRIAQPGTNSASGLAGSWDAFHTSFFGKQQWRADGGTGGCAF